MTNRPAFSSAAFLARSPLTPNMSDVRSELGSSPSPKLCLTDNPLKSLNLRDAQLMTPPFSPAKVGDMTLLPRAGDDLGDFFSTPKVEGPLFPEAVSATSAPKQKWVEVIQGRGIKRKLVDVTDEPDAIQSTVTQPGAGPGAWFVGRSLHTMQRADLIRYVEAEKARAGRTQLLGKRANVPLPASVTETPVKRTHKRGPSGGVKRRAVAPVTRSPRVKTNVDFQTTTRANGPVDTEDRPAKVPRPRPAPKVADPNAPPKVSKSQRADVEFEAALASLSDVIFYPPNDNLDKLGPNAMKVEWKSAKKNYQPSEYTRFQNLKDIKFHPKEIDLASTINMIHFAQYEESKRLIFQLWYQRKANGQSFTKTHAQQAAHVDVNKASALWTAFDKVGWFSDQSFELVKNNKKSWY